MCIRDRALRETDLMAQIVDEIGGFGFAVGDADVAERGNGCAACVQSLLGIDFADAGLHLAELGNRGVTLAANLLYNVYLKDLMTCHKAMDTELFRSLPLREDGFAIEPEITAQLILRGIRIFEVPVVYRARTREQGKKLTAFDGMRVLRTLVRCRLRAGRR